MTPSKVAIFWFRRDLRLFDNKGLYHALSQHDSVLPLFIFDDVILNELPANDHRVEYIHTVLESMDKKLQELGSGLLVRKGEPLDVFKQLLQVYTIDAVYSNADHEPYGRLRDKEVAGLLQQNGVLLHHFNDQFIMPPGSVLKPDGSPYTVFTPFGKKWKSMLSSNAFEHYPSENLLQKCCQQPAQTFKPLQFYGFVPSSIFSPTINLTPQVVANYQNTRDYPAIEATSRISVGLRFGTLSIRQVARMAFEANETFLNELIWREFFASVLFHFPHVVHQSFRKEYDNIQWRNNEKEFELWKKGMAGIPLVDAGMRQLLATGYMHNRVRMVVASFLTKHLLIDWRWGEEWFAEKLFDFELSSNNGNWQWSAGTGTDAAPYFRIFNPLAQAVKFDPEAKYMHKWIPELGTPQYPTPMVDLNAARDRCLMAYKVALQA